MILLIRPRLPRSNGEYPFAIVPDLTMEITIAAFYFKLKKSRKYTYVCRDLRRRLGIENTATDNLVSYGLKMPERK